MFILSNLSSLHPNYARPSVELKMNKRLKYQVQHHRNTIGFVVIFKLLKVPANTPPGDVTHSCDRSEHNMLGIAPPPLDGILQGRSQLLSWDTWEHRRTAPCASQQVRVSASLSSCTRTRLQVSSILFLSLKALQELCYQLDSKTATKAHQSYGKEGLCFSYEYCTLVRWLTPALWCMCFSTSVQHLLGAAAYCALCELLGLTTYRQYWNMAFNFEKEALESSWTTESLILWGQWRLLQTGIYS